MKMLVMITAGLVAALAIRIHQLERRRARWHANHPGEVLLLEVFGAIENGEFE